MAHLPALVSNEISEKEVTYMFTNRAFDWLQFLYTIITLRQSYDEFVTIL